MPTDGAIEISCDIHKGHPDRGRRCLAGVLSFLFRMVVVGALVVGYVGTAAAGERPSPGVAVACPEATGDPARYPGSAAPYRCVAAVTDLFGNVVVLREGRSAPGGFGLRHAVDGNVSLAVVERLVRTVRPRPAPQRRVNHIEQVREPGGGGVVDVWVVVDRAPSSAAPDLEPFGLVTAYCRDAGHPGAVRRCPDWLGIADR